MGAIRSDWCPRTTTACTSETPRCRTPASPLTRRVEFRTVTCRPVHRAPRGGCASSRLNSRGQLSTLMPVLPHARCRDHHHHASTDITQMVVTCEHVITYTPWCSPWWPRVASPPAAMRLRGPWMKTRTVALCRERPVCAHAMPTPCLRHAYAMPTPCLRAQSRQCTCA